MAVTLHNTLTGKKEVFKPLKENEVGMYNCGPTVYDSVHIGNLRTAVLNDTLRRVFEFNGYKVNQVMNITDVDDKTIRRSREENVSLKALTEKYEAKFFEDIQALGILRPHNVLRATDHIKDMIGMISTLLEKGAAYTTDDGIYFSIVKAKDYGALAGLSLDNPVQERIGNDEYDKENPRDFALWKFYKTEDGDVAWEAPFGKGRPGWHIECSAMATEALGPTIDIHTGGTDLLFPHHTNEIAQSEGATGKQFVHYWVHGAMINVSSEKMAKSKGNFFKLADLLEHSISPIAYRYWLLTAHYRTQVNFTWEAVQAAQTALFKLYKQFTEYGPENTGNADENYAKKFLDYINDDLDTPKAIALAWELLKDKKVAPEIKKATLLEFDKVLGLGLSTFKPVIETTEIPTEVLALAEAREEARKEKDFEKADALRKEIEARGFKLKDTETGFTLNPLD